MLNYESHQDTAKKLTVKVTENGLIRSTMRVAYAKMGRQEQVAPLKWHFFKKKIITYMKPRSVKSVKS